MPVKLPELRDKHLRAMKDAIDEGESIRGCIPDEDKRAQFQAMIDLARQGLAIVRKQYREQKARENIMPEPGMCHVDRNYRK